MSRILCIDYGRKRVGLAIGDTMSGVASPFRVVENDKQLIAYLGNLCEEYNINKVVLGLPLSDKYKEAEMAVREFADKLKKSYDFELEFQDERDSTLYAKALLQTKGWNEKRIKQNVDMYAAMKILEDYLRKQEK